MTKRDLTPFFTPASVAVVGASERATSAGGAVLQMLRRGGYAGRLDPVNPKGGEMFGMTARRSLAELDSPADLVVIAIRPDFVNDAVREAAETGHRAILILPGGFSEAGETGRAREAELVEIARRHDVTIAGPNCGGIIRLAGATRLAATFFRDLPPGGPLALVSQSGALAEEMIAHAQAHRIPLGTVVSVGNSLHLGVEDHLDFLGRDLETGAILLYLESARDFAALEATARRVSRDKPVMALIPGRTANGLAAARAHTGGAAEDDAAIEALCARAGIVRVASLRELQLAAKGFGFFGQGLAGRRALILSNSGGPGVLAADRATLAGLDLVELPAGMADELRAFLPGEASVRNPLDLLADAREDRFGPTLAAALRHREAFDAILTIHVVPFMVDAGPVIATLAAGAKAAPLPVFHSMMGTLEDRDGWFATMEAAGVPMFDNVEDMATTAALLARCGTIRD